MDNPLQLLQSIIEKDVFIRSSQRSILSSSGKETEWMFDFRKVILTPHVINLYAELFFDRYSSEYPFQVCGLEVAAIPLVTAIVMKSVERGTPVNGFFIRKSRKKEGLFNMVEGGINEHPIVLVDDLMNSGGSFVRQIEVLEGLKNKGEIQGSVVEVFSIVRFRDAEHYTYFNEKGIHITSLFTLNDFTQALSVVNMVNNKEVPEVNVFDVLWCYRGPSPQLWQVRPKSKPALHEGKLYFGTDSGYCMCLDATTGKEIWSYFVSIGKKGSEIFSSPRICRDVVVFGSYDGNIYALDVATGKRRWVYMEADWVKGSIDYSEKLGYVYVPLTFGLRKQQGKVVAIDITTGEKAWEFLLAGLVDGGVSYSKERNMLFFGDSNHTVYGIDAKKGVMLWKKEVCIELRGAPCVDDVSGSVVFGGLSLPEEEGNKGYVYVCDTITGKEKCVFSNLSFGAYGSTAVDAGKVFVSSLDKNVYCFDIFSGKLFWKVDVDARCFATPVVLLEKNRDKRLYVGANNGRLHEIDPATGKIVSITYIPERIVDGVVYDKENDRILVPTFANEIYSLQRKNKS